MLSHWLQHKQRLSNYIRQQVADPSMVDDILQEVYLKASAKHDSLQNEERVGAWLLRIAHNTIIDQFRRQQPQVELPETLLAPEADLAEQAHQQMAQCLEPMINQLPEKYRLPLQLSELKQQSQQQVADQLGLSLSGAKSRIQRARGKLKNQLTACCEIEVGSGGVRSFTPKSGSCDDC